MSAKEKLLPCPFCGGDRTPPVAVETPLKWSDRSYGAEAITPFGSYRVYAADGLTSPKWSFCFDEYYDEDEFECDSIDQGKALAQAHWDERVRSIFQVRMISADGWEPTPDMVEAARSVVRQILVDAAYEFRADRRKSSAMFAAEVLVSNAMANTIKAAMLAAAPAAPTKARDE